MANIASPHKIAASLIELWSPRIVAQVDDAYIKVAKVRGTLAWHKHEDEDELFFILKGRLRIEMETGDPVELSWARRFGLWAAYAFGQPLPPAWPGVGRNAFAHESGIHADGVLKDRGNYELYDDSTLGPFPADWYARDGRVVLTGEYGGKAGFRHVLDGLGVPVADGEEDLVFSLVQLCASATGKPLTDDELRLIAGYPRQLALLFPGLLSQG